MTIGTPFFLLIFGFGGKAAFLGSCAETKESSLMQRIRQLTLYLPIALGCLFQGVMVGSWDSPAMLGYLCSPFAAIFALIYWRVSPRFYSAFAWLLLALCAYVYYHVFYVATASTAAIGLMAPPLWGFLCLSLLLIVTEVIVPAVRRYVLEHQ